MRRKRDIRLVVSIFITIALSLIIPCLSIAGSLEPPASAVDASGNPVPTMTTPPPWSQKLPAEERFVLVLDGEAVLDKETGLVWEKSPSTTTYDWIHAHFHCSQLKIGNREGWHLPTIEQLASLVDQTNRNPALPTGHPFTNVQSNLYWSATTIPNSATVAWDVNFSDGAVDDDGKFLTVYVWCVRGGQSHDGW